MSDLLTLDSAQDALTTHSRQTAIVALDWERDGWRVSYAGAPAVKMSRDALLTEKFDGYDTVVVEQAHLRERNVYSVAQVYTEQELRCLPFKDKVRMFPGKKAADAARFAGNVLPETDQYGRPKIDKGKDAESIAVYSAAHPSKLGSWKAFRLPDEDSSRRLWTYRDALRADIQEAMNPLRAAWGSMNTAERYALPEIVLLCDTLDARFDKLSDCIKEQFGIRRSKNGIRVERMSAALTVYLAVRTRTGALRTRPDGEFIGCRFILGAIGMSHSYRPNMARSQLTHHGMRHYKGGRDGNGRCEYMRNLRNFIAFLRDA